MASFAATPATPVIGHVTEVSFHAARVSYAGRLASPINLDEIWNL